MDELLEPIRAERATVTFFNGLEVEGYRMPNGEYRVGMVDASLVVGYGRQWLSQVLSSRPKTLKSLQGMGFTGSQIEARVMREDSSGSSTASTIAIQDFIYVIAYASSQGRKGAIALQTALVTMSLNDFFRDAFGESPLSIDEKRKLFYEAYAATISPEKWREMDRADILALALLGDEEHLQHGSWVEGMILEKNEIYLGTEPEEEWPEELEVE